MWLAKPSVDARSEIMTSLGDTMWWRWRQAHPSAPVRLLSWEFEWGLAYIKALSQRERKKKSATDQSATTSGNTFIAKKRCEEESWCAEEMVEQSLAGLESNNQKTNRPWRFMWFFTACLNATKPSGFEKKKVHADTKQKGAVNYWLLIGSGVGLLEGALPQEFTLTVSNIHFKQDQINCHYFVMLFCTPALMELYVI